ncbi:MAG: tetratricopeptide repeat-containing sensor histidine kinase [Taibaiella sp.]|nr:tetratricopeptide repeat-containing sensor histidine kinase [Taibaiella sp.]
MLAFLAMLCSCTQRNTESREITPELARFFRYTDSLGDAGFVPQALDTVLKMRSERAGDMTVADQVAYYEYLNVIYNHRGENDKSIAVADSMIELLDKQGDEEDKTISRWKIVAFNMKADGLFATGSYTDAYNYYHLAQLLAMQSKDSCALRTYTYSLAMTLYRQQRYEQSAERFKEAYRQAHYCEEDFNVFYFKQEILDNIGLCYNALKKYDSAMHYYKRALTYLNHMTGKFPIKQMHVYEAPKAVVYGNMAEVFMHLGQHDSARVLYEHSIAINLQKGYANSDALIDQVKLAALYFKLGEPNLAKGTLDMVKVELDTIPDKSVETMWHKLMWQYNELRGDSLASFRHLRMYMVRNEEQANANKALMETDLDMRVRDVQKQYKINMLISDRKQQKVYMVIMAIFAGMALAIVILVLRNSRRTQRHVTELRNLNNEILEQRRKLQETLEKLQAKEKDNSRILKSVAHDVMSPIAAIVSLADIMINDPNASRDEQLEIAGMIKEASTNSLTLSKDILQASRDIGDNTLKKEKTDINQLIRKAVDLMSVKAHDKGQKIELSLPDAPVYANVDGDKIRRVLMNILSNAVKFSYENTVIKLTMIAAAGNVHITVTDSGIGISEKHKGHVFDMFTDARMVGTAGEPSHGLGLSISLQVIRSHGGDIWFESEEGKGTAFHISFPANL